MKRAALLAMLFIFFTYGMPVGAQSNDSPTSGNPPDFCIPELPDDLALLEQCLDFYASQDQPINNPADDAVVGPGAGTWGMASAYNSKDDTILFVSSGSSGGTFRIFAQFLNAKTNEPIGDRVRIDQSGSFSGSPKAIYNSTTNNFLITWTGAINSSNASNLYGRFMNGDGSLPAGEFPIAAEYDVYSNYDVNLNTAKQTYLFTYDVYGGPSMVMRTMTATGVVSPDIALDRNTEVYEGQVSGVFIPTRNEYWYTYVTVVSGDNTSSADERIYFARIDATTGTQIGEPVQLSQTRIGRNAFASRKLIMIQLKTRL